MVVKSRLNASPELDLGYLGFFLGLRVNQLVMDRMRAAGAVISSTEMMIYEALKSSGTSEFKDMLKYLK